MAKTKTYPVVNGNQDRGVYLAVYDPQGGPLPDGVERLIGKLAEQVSNLYPSLAINTSVG